jgi:hypothetical protein
VSKTEVFDGSFKETVNLRVRHKGGEAAQDEKWREAKRHEWGHREERYWSMEEGRRGIVP